MTSIQNCLFFKGGKYQIVASKVMLYIYSEPAPQFPVTLDPRQCAWAFHIRAKEIKRKIHQARPLMGICMTSKGTNGTGWVQVTEKWESSLWNMACISIGLMDIQINILYNAWVGRHQRHCSRERPRMQHQYLKLCIILWCQYCRNKLASSLVDRQL